MIAISGDGPEALERMHHDLGLSFPLLHDAGLAISKAYGVREDVTGSTVERRHTSLPATFVVDRSGIVRYAHVGRARDDRPDVEEVLAAVASARKGPPEPAHAPSR